MPPQAALHIGSTAPDMAQRSVAPLRASPRPAMRPVHCLGRALSYKIIPVRLPSKLLYSVFYVYYSRRRSNEKTVRIRCPDRFYLLIVALSLGKIKAAD